MRTFPALTRSPRFSAIAAILASGLLTAACAGPWSGGTRISPSPTAHPYYTVDTSPKAVVMALSENGGMVPDWFRLTNMPEFVIYGDGRIILGDPGFGQDTAELLPNLREVHLSPDELQKILAAADDAGLLGADDSFDAWVVTDMGTSVFVTTVAGKTHRVDAYALYSQFESGDRAIDAERARLIAFRATIQNLSAFLGYSVTDKPYEPTSMLVYWDMDQYSPGRLVDWPLAVDPATAGKAMQYPTGRCTAVSGADMTAFLAAAQRGAPQESAATASKRTYVLFRPLYPNESGC